MKKSNIIKSQLGVNQSIIEIKFLIYNLQFSLNEEKEKIFNEKPVAYN
jgi:hypothetical protein